MNIYLPVNRKPFRLFVTVNTSSPQIIKITAQDERKQATYYLNRKSKVAGNRTFVLKFPQSPKMMKLSIYNYANGNIPDGNDPTFSITEFRPDKLKTCPLWEKPSTFSFIKFAQKFAENASILSAGVAVPHIYRSDDTNFTIDYYDIIRSKGRPINTPARIGHNRGIIEVSKNAFLGYTVPMRMIVLLHEYSHKYLNPTINREIGDEVGADINALKIYLSLGYPDMEAHTAFLTVFRMANNKDNHKRYLIINDFMTKFNQGLIQGSCDRNA